jgi:hypothetical protein
MVNDEPAQSETATDAVFAMDPEVTMRELVRYLVAGQQQMADLSRIAHNTVQGRDGADVRNLVAEWKSLERRWAGRTLPWLTAAMKLALEVYDTFGPGMTRIADPVEAAIWNNKYFVWERELATAAEI